MPEKAEWTDEIKKSEMSIFDHLAELRSRLIKSFLAISVGFIGSFFFSEHLFRFLSLPLLETLPDIQKRLVFTSLPELFMVYIKVAIFAGIVLAAPVIFYQFWKFISPGLYHHERRLLLPFVVFTSLFFFAGVAFSYYHVFPFAFRFFIGLGNQNIEPMITVKDYLKFATTMLLVFGFVFEMPVIAGFLAKIGIIDSALLRKKRKYAIILIFVTAAILTPPDVISQLMLAAPMMILYEISVFFAYLVGKKKN